MKRFSTMNKYDPLTMENKCLNCMIFLYSTNFGDGDHNAGSHHP